MRTNKFTLFIVLIFTLFLSYLLELIIYKNQYININQIELFIPVKNKFLNNNTFIIINQ